MAISTLLFAEGSMSRLEQEFIRWLSVAGGFFMGVVVTHLLVRGVGTFVFKKEMPHSLMKIARIAGGLASSILVYFLLLPSGGSGPGGSGNLSLPSTNPATEATEPKVQPTESKKAKPVTVPPLPKESAIANEEVVTVRVLRPSPDKKWYLYEAEKEPLTEKEVRDRIASRDQPGQKPIKVVKIVIDSEDSSKKAASILDELVKALGKSVLTPPEMRNPN